MFCQGFSILGRTTTSNFIVASPLPGRLSSCTRNGKMTSSFGTSSRSLKNELRIASILTPSCIIPLPHMFPSFVVYTSIVAVNLKYIEILLAFEPARHRCDYSAHSPASSRLPQGLLPGSLDYNLRVVVVHNSEFKRSTMACVTV